MIPSASIMQVFLCLQKCYTKRIDILESEEKKQWLEKQNFRNTAEDAYIRNLGKLALSYVLTGIIQREYEQKHCREQI